MPPTPVFIIAPQRSGTNLLRKALNTSENFHDLNEVFNIGGGFWKFRLDLLAEHPDLGFPTAANQNKVFDLFLEHLSSQTPTDFGLVDIKYNSTHNLNAIWQSPADSPFLLRAIAERGLPALHLVRENILETYVSAQLANHSRGQAAQQKDEKARVSIRIDPQHMLRQLELRSAEIDTYRQWFAGERGLKSLEISYGSLIDSQGQFSQTVAEAIAQFLGISEPLTFVVPPQTATPLLSEIVENYESEIRPALQASSFAYLLEQIAIQSAPSLDAPHFIKKPVELKLKQALAPAESKNSRSSSTALCIAESPVALLPSAPSLPHPVYHYLKFGAANPHPLFDSQYYLDQNPDIAASEMNPLWHYLEFGWKENRNPHPLFDLQYYLQHNPDVIALGIDPLRHYLEFGGQEGRNPHYLFNAPYYLSQLSSRPSQTPLEHFLTHDGISPHVLFDLAYYRMQVEKAQADGLIAEVQENLLCYYLKQGWKGSLNPHRAFDLNFYRQQIQRSDVEPLYHYLILKGFAQFSPHPAFDLDYYCSQLPDFSPAQEPAILHFLRASDADRVSPSPVLSPAFYLNFNKDVKRHKTCPKLHFLLYGYREIHRPVNNFFSNNYLYHLYPEKSFADVSPVQFYLSERLYQRRRILLVGHNGDRSGAPLILLRLMQDLSRYSNLDLFLLLAEGGELVEEYKRYGHVHVLPPQGDRFLAIHEHRPEFHQAMQSVLNFLAHTPVDAAICNTVEVRHLADGLHQAGIPILTLVHEMPGDYQLELSQWQRIAQQSQKIIFPSQFVADKARALMPELMAQSEVLGQGLLRDNFGRYGRQAARARVRRELAIPEDAIVVLGCGTMDYRKGIDRFIEAAKRVIQQSSERSYHFVWVGQEIQLDMDQADAYSIPANWRRSVTHVPETPDPETYFLAADLFLLTSRCDPFPCVVHEAMACALPVIYFEGAGGAIESVDQTAGIPVDNLEQMVEAIQQLGNSPAQMKAIGQVGQERVQRQHQFKDYTQGLVQTLAKQIGRTPESFGYYQLNESNQKKSIYFLTPGWSISGVNTFTIHLIKNLNRLGYDAKILFTRGRNSALPENPEHYPDVPFIFLQPYTHKAYPHRIWHCLLDFFKHHDPCIIIPNYDYVASAISPLLPSQVGVVGIAHSDDLDHYEHVYRLGHWWNHIVSVSQMVGREVVKHNGSFADKASTIYYGVPVYRPLTDADLRLKAGTGQRTLQITFAGRFVYEQKRIERYVELAQLLDRSNVDFRLKLIGDGEAFDWVCAELAPLVAKGLVELPGRMNEMAVNRALAESDIFLLLSDYEGLPLALLEAMTHGCIPLVAEMRSGIPEVIQSGENGFIYSPRRLHDFVEIIRSLSENATQRFEVARHAYRSVERYRLRDVDMAASYAKIFDEIFAEVEADQYIRPESFGVKSSLPGVIPPVWLT